VRRTPIKRKEAKRIMEEASKSGVEFGAGKFELAEIMQQRGARILVLDGEPVLVIIEAREMVPFISAYGTRVQCPWIKVDERAAKHIVSGADVMIPGITSYEEFKDGDAVVTLDLEGHAIASGIALLGSSELKQAGKGRAIRSIHWLGDEHYKMTETL
jgi:predicted RNA-binding protein (TIGR00451 family)